MPKTRSTKWNVVSYLVMVMVLFSMAWTLSNVSAASNEVVPINWSNLPISTFNDATSLKMKLALNSACTKDLNEDWANMSNYGKEGQYIDFGSEEADIRPRAQHAMSIAVALKTNAYDEKLTDFNSEFAKSVALTWIKSLAKDHKVNGGLGTAWGDQWQSPLWAYRCGLAAWFLWDDLSTTDQEYVRKMVEHEANRFSISAPLFAGEDYKNDTKGEEDQWYAGILQLAYNMMPNHSRAAFWESQGKRYRLAAVAAPKDVNSSTVVDGKSLKDWGITSYNIDNEGTLGNHDMYPHPDYMCAVMNHPSEGVMMYRLGNHPIPAANRYNLDIMFKYLIDKKLPTGTIYNDDGTINWPISGETYRNKAYAQYYNIDLFADYYGYDHLASRKASYFLPMHVQNWLDYIKTTSGDRSWAEESPATVWLAKCLLMSSTVEGSNQTTDYILTYKAEEGGSITGAANQKVSRDSIGREVRAVAKGGYKFIGWSDGVTTEARQDALITKNIDVTASFEKTDKSKSQEKGIPYYIKDGKNIYIGISAEISGEMKYIAPKGVEVLFKKNPKAFNDISSHWAEDNINFVAEREIMNGTADNVFSPDVALTRGMLVAILGRLANVDVTGKTSNFDDVNEQMYYSPYIEWANENSIVKGVGNNNFEPERAIEREEMAVIFTNYLKYLGKGSVENWMVDLGYSDKGNISEWAFEGVAFGTVKGLFQGEDGNNFVPKGTATRAEASAVLQRVIVDILK